MKKNIRFGIWHKTEKIFWRKGLYRLGYRTAAEASAEIVRMNEYFYRDNAFKVKAFEANAEEL